MIYQPSFLPYQTHCFPAQSVAQNLEWLFGYFMLAAADILREWQKEQRIACSIAYASALVIIQEAGYAD